ncbi:MULTISPECIES: phage GP46 family protein [unclassified Pseudomonas]|uniref:phage GP46 family protein n=1 Tax=unclassified Pseudomonas TaxID=196821 RepID=UPI0015A2D221|nr:MULTISPECIES: phage GP46 family protein [unclassified Pseudomonas]NWC92614.1 phage GP46 family protein [Pseudomonas sp. IPO3779]NWD15611.1 phage GP46 family protein [Pseudomonas sp. IPO3778]
MTDISTTWISSTGNGDWSISGGALASGDDLTSAVLISLFTDRQANDDDVPPDGGNDLRGWWGDAGEDVLIGSRLWLLDRSKLTPAVVNTAKIYIEEALKWLIDDQVALGVSVATAIASSSQLNSLITITRQDGSVVPLQFNWAWSQV